MVGQSCCTKYDAEKANSLVLQVRLDAISREHGNFSVGGILLTFCALKAHQSNSSGNWARQDVLLITVDREITARCISTVPIPISTSSCSTA